MNVLLFAFHSLSRTLNYGIGYEKHSHLGKTENVTRKPCRQIDLILCIIVYFVDTYIHISHTGKFI